MKSLNRIKKTPLPKTKEKARGISLDKEKMTFLKDTEYDGKGLRLLGYRPYHQ